MNIIDTPWVDRVLVIRDAPLQLDWFAEDELEIARAFKLDSRRDEWLLSRMAAKQLALQLGVAADPRAITVARPWLAGTDWRVSLSHSASYAGAAIAREPIGIDVQLIRKLDERAAHLFLSPDETAALEQCTIQHRIVHWWCAKEAAWKRRSDEFKTLRQLPLQFVDERDGAMRFDAVETRVIGDAIVAVTLPTS
jgi:phosphopantetheinyl transferase